jgi:hypothetical protein
MMKAGMAVVDVTPPVNVPLNGFETRKTGSRGVHDPLFARALVLDNGRTRLGWVIADLIGFPREMTAKIRREAADSMRVAETNVMISGTHTHGGPGLRPAPEIQADHAAHGRWLDGLPGKIVQALSAAAGRMEPVELACGRAVCDTVQHNRRFHMKDGTIKMVWDKFDPADVAWLGPVDPAVQVLALRSGGRLGGAVAQFACHATAVVGDNFLITADWPGVTCREMKSLAGSPDLWAAVAQGCCGDITPSPPRGTFEICEAKGKEIARIAGRALGRVEPHRSGELGAVRIPVRLARKKPGSDPAPTGEFHETEVQVLRIGDAAVVGLPGEAFVGIGLEIKAHSDFPWTFAGSYANDYDDADLGYIPTAVEYAGGYEATASMVVPGSDAILIAAAREALSKLG